VCMRGEKRKGLLGSECTENEGSIVRLLPQGRNNFKNTN